MNAHAASHKNMDVAEDFGALFEESLAKNDIVEGSVVKGIVIAVERILCRWSEP